MKNKLGILLILLGMCLIAGSLGLFLYNENQKRQASESVEAIIPRVVDAIYERTERENQPEAEEQPVAAYKDPKRPMPVTEIDGYGYIGFLSIPSLGLELPVMTDWSYPQLKIAPCRYSGSMYTDDLVLMAHNFPKHFGKLKDLKTGEELFFTDMDGELVKYQVVAKDILDPAAIEEMTAGDFDLTLFTCTYGGKSRVTVRCDRAEE